MVDALVTGNSALFVSLPKNVFQWKLVWRITD